MTSWPSNGAKRLCETAGDLTTGCPRRGTVPSSAEDLSHGLGGPSRQLWRVVGERLSSSHRPLDMANTSGPDVGTKHGSLQRPQSGVRNFANAHSAQTPLCHSPRTGDSKTHGNILPVISTRRSAPSDNIVADTVGVSLMNASWRSEWRSDSRALGSAGTKVGIGGIPRPSPDRHGRFTMGPHGTSGSGRGTLQLDQLCSDPGQLRFEVCNWIDLNNTDLLPLSLLLNFSRPVLTDPPHLLGFEDLRGLCGHALSRAFDECHRICNAHVDWRDSNLTLGAHQCCFQTCLLFDVVDNKVRNGCFDPCDFGRSHRAHFCGALLWLLLGKHRILMDTRAWTVDWAARWASPSKANKENLAKILGKHCKNNEHSKRNDYSKAVRKGRERRKKGKGRGQGKDEKPAVNSSFQSYRRTCGRWGHKASVLPRICASCGRSSEFFCEFSFTKCSNHTGCCENSNIDPIIQC